ncbi:hypothetical protein JCM19274_1203 [Algibacter lectus]|uniref:Uncharacterized protein n=1 Tax=Algibacter lectus TaxID=221126 RepID=A0A090X632_9FLAO|nr:hypothetical protein JCM19274_1203 [Algibacter lectus]
MEAVLEQIELGKKQSILAFEYNAPHFDTLGIFILSMS